MSTISGTKLNVIRNILYDLYVYYKFTGESIFKYNAFLNVYKQIGRITQQEKPVGTTPTPASVSSSPSRTFSLNYVLSLPGVGRGIRERVLEIVRTGTLVEWKKIKHNTQFKLFTELSGLNGFGPVAIKRLVRTFPRANSVEYLRNLASHPKYLLQFTAAQRLTLKYYRHLTRPVPRTTIDHFKRILTAKLPLTFHILGSYRRGLHRSGDIDMIIISQNSPDAIYKFEKILRELKILLGIYGHGNTKGMYVIKIGTGTITQLDLRVFTRSQYPFALMYFTGSKRFNQNIRKLALNKGMLLNEYGIYDRRRPSVSLAKKLKIKTEKDIFTRALGIKYIPPEKRNM